MMLLIKENQWYKCWVVMTEVMMLLIKENNGISVGWL